jgi:hypothetical protein
MAVAEVPREPGERRQIGGPRLDQRLGSATISMSPPSSSTSASSVRNRTARRSRFRRKCL